MVNGFEFCSLESKIDMDFLYSAFNAEDQFLYSTNSNLSDSQQFNIKLIQAL